jgi:hypothetical protein
LVQEKGKTYLKGTVVRNSLNLKEPDRPMYVVLEKSTSNKNRSAETASESQDNITSSLAASPNPFSQELNVTLNLSAEQYGRLMIIDVSGKEVFQTPQAIYKEGVSNSQLQLNLAHGIYTLQFVSGDMRLSTLIIKK